MRKNKLYFFTKDIIVFILAVTFSLLIFFSNKSIYIQKIENRVIDFMSFIYYPKEWYEDILLVKAKNELLNQRIVQLKLLNSKLENYTESLYFNTPGSLLKYALFTQEVDEADLNGIDFFIDKFNDQKNPNE